jgi:hypothetical protein
VLPALSLSIPIKRVKIEVSTEEKRTRLVNVPNVSVVEGLGAQDWTNKNDVRNSRSTSLHSR